MDFSLRRLVLDAGCGSRGNLPHRAARSERVIGLDVDLPSLALSAKRCQELVEPLVARRSRQPSYRSSSNRKYQVGKSPCRSRLLAPSNFALDQRSR